MDQAVMRLTTALTLRHKASNNKVELTSSSLKVLTSSDDGVKIKVINSLLCLA
jgi:hypothetical protein